MRKLLYVYPLQLIGRLCRDEKGAALVEYGILIGLIAVLCIAAVSVVGTQISSWFSFVGSSLTPGI
jgi:pilus assembly protein Flp/PilA